jgi:phosphoribosylformylglycinamidine (FGAM) synthase-like amidotransferase family enzyme
MSIRFRALVISVPGARGIQAFEEALRTVGFEPEILSMDQLIESRLDQEQLCVKYRVLILPGGNTYGSVLGGGRGLAIKIQYALRWNLAEFAAQGGLVLGVGTGFQSLLHLKCFGDDVSIRINDQAVYQESWIKVTPVGNRCVWLRGLGTLELPINQLETVFVIDPFAYVEALGRLERLSMNCLALEGNTLSGSESVMGLCDPTGRIFGMLPHPEFFLNWTNTDDWIFNTTRAAAPGQGLALFENAMKAASA